MSSNCVHFIDYPHVIPGAQHTISRFSAFEDYGPMDYVRKGGA